MLLVLSCLLFVGFSVGDIPTDGRTYAMANEFGGWLGARSGNLCGNLGGLSELYVGEDFDFQERFRWVVYSSFQNDSATFHYLTNVSQGGEKYNSMSYEDFDASCALNRKALILTANEVGNRYRIRAEKTGQCLMSMGSEVGVFWTTNCDGGVGTSWYFKTL